MDRREFSGVMAGMDLGTFAKPARAELGEVLKKLDKKSKDSLPFDKQLADV